MSYSSEMARLKPEAYNTNNAWGFAGVRGKHYTLPNALGTVLIGKAYYRHLPPTRVQRVQLAGGEELTGKAALAFLASLPTPPPLPKLDPPQKKTAAPVGVQASLF